MTGFTNADAYEAGRPSYPEEAVHEIARGFELGPQSSVLDLAAGTGKLTRLIAPLVGMTIAVEPSEGMRAKLREQLPGIDARAGTAEDLPLPDASVDAVTVGEAFHWFDVERAAREIARVLRPRGGLALVWNRTVGPAFEPELQALLEPHRQAAGGYPSGDGQWRPALERTGLFGPLTTDTFDHTHSVSAEELVSLVSSWSWIVNIPGARREKVLAEVSALAQPTTLRFRTELHRTRRRR
jgi:SAM-dependent methyltransferase